MGPLRGEMIADEGALARLAPEWDALAVARRRPFCAPAWMLAWWRHVAPRDARLRAVAVFEGDRLRGLAPFYADSKALGLVRYRLLAARTSTRIEPLAAPGYEDAVARAVGVALAAAEPRPHCIALDGCVAGSPWPASLASSGGARPAWAHRASSAPVPALTLAGRTCEEWFASRSAHFRREVRRRRRRLEEAGAVFRMASTPEELDHLLAHSARLHYARWSWRGGSSVLDARVERMLAQAGRELLGEGRFRLWVVEVGGEIISSQIFVAAGGEVTYWLGGFDERWARLAPSLLGIIAGIEHAWSAGDERVVLGAGGQDYKYTLSDEEEAVEWTVLVPRGLRYPLTRAQLSAMYVRRRALQWLSANTPPAAKQRIRRMRRGVARLPRAA